MFNTQKQGNNSRNQNSLVNSVESGVAWVELDGGEDSISGWGSSISTSNSWSSSICGSKRSSSNSWGSSISSSNSWSSRDGWGSSISRSNGWSSSICGSKRSSSISGSNSWGSGISGWESNLGRSLHNTSLGSIISLEESSLSLNNLWGVNNWSKGVNWGNSSVDWGSWEVITSNTEAKGISNIVDSVDSSLIGISVRSSHSSKGIARLLLGRVDVLVSISNIAEFILSLILRASWGSNWSSSNNWGSSSISGSNWSSSDSWGSSSIGSGSNWGSNSWSSSIGGSGNWSSNGWGSSNSWGSSIGSGGNWSSNSWGSGNWSSSKRTSIQSCNWGTIGKLSINSCSSNWGGISSSIRSSISIAKY